MAVNRSRRKSVPLLAQLHAALHQLGLDPTDCDLDHSPPLALRDWDPVKQDTIPPANDPRHLYWMPRTAHRDKTSGARRDDVANSDVHKIAKVKRLTGQTPKPKSRKLQGRGFQKRRK